MLDPVENHALSWALGLLERHRPQVYCLGKWTSSSLMLSKATYTTETLKPSSSAFDVSQEWPVGCSLVVCPNTHGSKEQQWWPQYSSNLPLKVFSDGADATLLGRLFHKVTTRKEKNVGAMWTFERTINFDWFSWQTFRFRFRLRFFWLPKYGQYTVAFSPPHLRL